MSSVEKRTIVVTGATGRQGGAVARHLLAQGWQVRASTRNPQSTRAHRLAALGARMVQGDMNDPRSLTPVFDGAYGAYSVQNPYAAGSEEAEIRQGKHVAEAAKAAGLQHLVYGSAGTGRKGTGIPSWESKLLVEEHASALGLPLTVLRPMAFMELMTDAEFYPAMAIWHVMPELTGWSRQLPWLCTGDLGVIAARVFAQPERFIGQDLKLASDVRSIEECRTSYRTVMGKKPPHFPMPAWLFARFGLVGRDLSAMWRWLRTGDVELDTGPARSIHPDALSVEAWLRTQTV